MFNDLHPIILALSVLGLGMLASIGLLAIIVAADINYRRKERKAKDKAFETWYNGLPTKPNMQRSVHFVVDPIPAIEPHVDGCFSILTHRVVRDDGWLIDCCQDCHVVRGVSGHES